MNESHIYNQFRYQVSPALESKLEEFQMLGYETISVNELWEYLIKKKWKKVKEDIRIYEIIQDILSVKVSDYMSYATIEAFKDTKFSLNKENNWKEILS
ncbi:MAG: post-transcriptional regulator [Bacillota bacterium]|nr:post-transcriptional regulator [Bacillota bacterium]